MLYYIRLNLGKVLAIFLGVLLIGAVAVGATIYFQNKQSIAPYDTNPFPQPETTEPIAPLEPDLEVIDPELANQPIAPLVEESPEPQSMNPNESDPNFFEAATIISQAKDYIVQGMVAQTIDPKQQKNLSPLPTNIDKVPSYAIPANYNIQATWDSETYDVCIQIELDNQTWFQKDNDPMNKGTC
jgi:hypothetical protein